jgi:RNA polymerase sigma factor (sigma-70 family)
MGSEPGMGIESAGLDLGQLPDADLVSRFVARRDAAAFSALVGRYGPLVLGLCRRLVRREQDAEDAFQATFLVLVRKAGSIGKHESVGSWLYGVAYRVALKANTAAARRRARETPLRDIAAPEAGCGATENDLGAVLDAEVNRLPPKHRRAVVLCYLQGCSAQEAARVLGCARGTILSRLARARERLRGRLVRRGLILTASAVAVALMRNRAEAAVPGPLAESTVQAVTGNAATAGLASAQAVALAKGVVNTMWLIKLTKVGALLLVVALGGAVALGSRAWAERDAVYDKDANGKDAKPAKLDGTWLAVELSKDGNAVPKDEVEKTKVVFKDGTLTVTDGDKVKEGKVQIDITKKPATIDITIAEGEGKEETHLGIFEVDGDTLKICFAHAGNERPTAFESQAGSGLRLGVFKRSKE